MRKVYHCKVGRVYLGDSVYADLDGNGGVVLTTSNGYPDSPRNVIILKQEVLEGFLEWAKNVFDHSAPTE